MAVMSLVMKGKSERLTLEAPSVNIGGCCVVGQVRQLDNSSTRSKEGVNAGRKVGHILQLGQFSLTVGFRIGEPVTELHSCGHEAYMRIRVSE